MRTAPAAIPQRVGHRPPANQRRLRRRRLRARVVSVCEHPQAKAGMRARVLETVLGECSQGHCMMAKSRFGALPTPKAEA